MPVLLLSQMLVLPQEQLRAQALASRQAQTQVAPRALLPAWTSERRPTEPELRRQALRPETWRLPVREREAGHAPEPRLKAPKVQASARPVAGKTRLPERLATAKPAEGKTP